MNVQGRPLIEADFSSFVRVFPLFPDTTSQTVTHPSVHIFELLLNTCYSVVLKPALLYFFQFVNPLIESEWSGFSGNGFDFLFQVLPSLFANYQLVFSFFSLLKGRNKSKTKHGEVAIGSVQLVLFLISARGINNSYCI